MLSTGMRLDQLFPGRGPKKEARAGTGASAFHLARDGHDVQRSCYDIGVTGIDDGSHEFLLCTARAQMRERIETTTCLARLYAATCGGTTPQLEAIPFARGNYTTDLESLQNRAASPKYNIHRRYAPLDRKVFGRFAPKLEIISGLEVTRNRQRAA
jgi:hypothetical protein